MNEALRHLNTPSLEDQETTGVCVVCHGKIVEGFKLVRPLSVSFQTEKVSAGLHCKRCGLRYAFLPPDNIG